LKYTIYVSKSFFTYETALEFITSSLQGGEAPEFTTSSL